MSGLAANWLDVSPFLHGWWLIVIVFNKLNKNLFFIFVSVILLWLFVCAHLTLCSCQPSFLSQIMFSEIP